MKRGVILLCLLCLLCLLLITILLKNYRFQMEKYSNKIDKIFVINLKKNTERLEKFMENAKKANIEVERFDGIYGKDLNDNDSDILKYFVKGHKLRPGQIGCALSHIKIWEKVIKNNYNNVLVFEDDAIIPQNFWGKFNKAFNELPDDWDMLLLGCCTCNGSTINKTNLLKANSEGNWCMTSFLINRQYCKKIIDRIYKNKVGYGIDGYIKSFYKNDNVYISLPPFILQNKSFESDIIMGKLGNTLKIDNNKPIIWS